MSGDLWLSSHAACAQLSDETFKGIQERNKQPRSSSIYVKKNAEIRSALAQFGCDLIQLREKLVQLSAQHKIGQREADRRQTMINELVLKEKQLNLAFKNEDSTNLQRSSLLTQSNGVQAYDAWTNGDRMERVETDDLIDIGQIRHQQQHMIAEQDQGLEALSRIIGRQKQLALDIGGEVESQNDIIDEITDHTDQTNTRLIRETKHVTFVDKKESSHCLCMDVTMWAIANQRRAVTIVVSAKESPITTRCDDVDESS